MCDSHEIMSDDGKLCISVRAAVERTAKLSPSSHRLCRTCLRCHPSVLWPVKTGQRASLKITTRGKRKGRVQFFYLDFYFCFDMFLHNDRHCH